MKVHPQPGKPGQHEDQLAILARIEEALKKPQLPIKIEITCKCPPANSDEQILEIVKEILDRLSNWSSKEEVDAILGPVLERIKQVHSVVLARVPASSKPGLKPQG